MSSNTYIHLGLLGLYLILPITIYRARIQTEHLYVRTYSSDHMKNQKNSGELQKIFKNWIKINDKEVCVSCLQERGISISYDEESPLGIMICLTCNTSQSINDVIESHNPKLFPQNAKSTI